MTNAAVELTQPEMDAIYARVRILSKSLDTELRRIGFKKRQNRMTHAASGVSVGTLGNREGLTVLVFTGNADNRTRTIYRVTADAQIAAIVSSLNLD